MNFFVSKSLWILRVCSPALRSTWKTIFVSSGHFSIVALRKFFPVNQIQVATPNVAVCLSMNLNHSNSRITMKVGQVAGVNLGLFGRVLVSVLCAQVIFVVLLDLWRLGRGPEVSLALLCD